MMLLRAAFCLMVCLLLGSPAAQADSKAEVSLGITVLASSSLTDVIAELSRIYATKQGITVSSFFGAPAELAGEIERGESADVIITEDENSMQRLKQQGLIDVYTINNMARNRLTLAVPNDYHLLRQLTPPVPLEEVLPNINEKAILVLPDVETVPLGIHAKEVFERMGYWDIIQKVMLRSETARRSLYLIAKGKNAGVLYASDAMNNPEIVVLSYFPEKSHRPIIYQGAVVAGLNMPQARGFLDFLKTKEAEAVFKRYGFLTP